MYEISCGGSIGVCPDRPLQRASEATNGKIVVARLGDDVTVKRFQRKGSQVWLLPENEELSPIEVDLASQHLTIEGLAVGVINEPGRNLP